MAKKCIGVKEYTGAQCNRLASSGSDFCFMHKPQEGDARIAYLEHDVYHCPDDGQQLLFVPNEGSYRCDMCGGVLLSAKDIDSEVLESIMELPEVVEGGLRVECPTCSTDNDLSDGETALTNFAVEWYFWIERGTNHHRWDDESIPMWSVECWPLHGMRINLVCRPGRV